MPAAKKTKPNTAKDELNIENLENISIEEAFKRVDDVISAMQEDDITLEDSFRRYKEGMDLLKTAGSLIDKVEKDALKISEDGDLEIFEDDEE
ncbi:exodeoxyribonuclease VII small subunit [Butyrivibrio sp. TB]|uniref:exodeoxyribonuclease VII small subunit n=1 Tax=Butyrivibrio sp. TB TaxID=1520809 RepID=UPI0008CF8E18|nr:exodeoxyribonuclease VII small subunit [Butyrivibrio sp. TB]SEQ42525.1 Exodeoxyribonuclease VII small subunit [Butyrivibrio sp. TB]